MEGGQGSLVGGGWFHIFAIPKVLQNKSISLHLQMITSCLSMRWVIVIVEFKVPGKGDLLFEVVQLLSCPNCRRSWYYHLVRCAWNQICLGSTNSNTVLSLTNFITLCHYLACFMRLYYNLFWIESSFPDRRWTLPLSALFLWTLLLWPLFFYVPWCIMTSQWVMTLLVTSIMMSQWIITFLCVHIMISNCIILCISAPNYDIVVILVNSLKLYIEY